MTTTDRNELKQLLSAALRARLDYDETLRAIENALGGDCDDLDSTVDALAGTTNGDDDEAIDMLLGLKVHRDEHHPQTDEHLAACPSCMMAHDKALPD